MSNTDRGGHLKNRRPPYNQPPPQPAAEGGNGGGSKKSSDLVTLCGMDTCTFPDGRNGWRTELGKVFITIEVNPERDVDDEKSPPYKLHAISQFDDSRDVTLCGLYLKDTAAGDKFLSGSMGWAKVFLFKAKNRRAGEAEYNLVLAPRPPRNG